MTDQEIIELVKGARAAMTASQLPGSENEAITAPKVSEEPTLQFDTSVSPKQIPSSARTQRTSQEGTIAIIMFIAACAILAVVGGGGMGSFVALVIIGFFPALIVYLWWLSLEARSGARFLLILGVGAAFVFLLGRQEQAAKLEAARRIERGKAAAAYRVSTNAQAKTPPRGCPSELSDVFGLGCAAVAKMNSGWREGTWV